MAAFYEEDSNETKIAINEEKHLAIQAIMFNFA